MLRIRGLPDFFAEYTLLFSAYIVDAINKLPKGDVKKLQGQKSYRLRVGDYRVIFDKNGDILYIEKIDNRGQIYK